MSILNEHGWEVPDQTPVAVPAYIKKYDQRDTIKELIRQALSQEAQDAGYETFEEADDFDVGDDYDPSSPYEEQFDPETGTSLWDNQEPIAGNAFQDANAPSATPASETGGSTDEGGASLSGNSEKQ